MNQYHPELNPAAYSIEWLQARRATLAQLGLSGSLHEKKSKHRKAELAVIDAGLLARGTKPVQLPRARVLPQSAAGDVAPAQPVWPPVATPLAQGLNGYSAAVQQVEQDHAPARNSFYA